MCGEVSLTRTSEASQHNDSAGAAPVDGDSVAEAAGALSIPIDVATCVCADASKLEARLERAQARHLRDTSETPPRRLRDTSETLPRHLPDKTALCSLRRDISRAPCGTERLQQRLTPQLL